MLRELLHDPEDLRLDLARLLRLVRLRLRKLLHRYLLATGQLPAQPDQRAAALAEQLVLLEALRRPVSVLLLLGVQQHHCLLLPGVRGLRRARRRGGDHFGHGCLGLGGGCGAGVGTGTGVGLHRLAAGIRLEGWDACGGRVVSRVLGRYLRPCCLPTRSELGLRTHWLGVLGHAVAVVLEVVRVQELLAALNVWRSTNLLVLLRLCDSLFLFLHNLLLH